MASTVARDFRDLRVYTEAFAVAMEIYDRSKGWPPEERYALTDQVRRSSRAACACIAEAWYKRRYPRHFASKLSDAASEAAEVLVWIEFAEACGLLDSSDANLLSERMRAVLGGLTKMQAQPETWCTPTAVREPESGYEV